MNGEMGMSKIDELKQQIRKLENKLAVEEKKEKASNIECPFRYGDIYWWICHDGDVIESNWKDAPWEFDSFIFGNVFETEEEARFERDKRVFLIQFTNFRNKRNGDWKPDWKNQNEDKYYIYYNFKDGNLRVSFTSEATAFTPLGYFKKLKDVYDALDMFKDDIKRLLIGVV